MQEALCILPGAPRINKWEFDFSPTLLHGAQGMVGEGLKEEKAGTHPVWALPTSQLPKALSATTFNAISLSALWMDLHMLREGPWLTK